MRCPAEARDEGRRWYLPERALQDADSLPAAVRRREAGGAAPHRPEGRKGGEPIS